MELARMIKFELIHIDNVLYTCRVKERLFQYSGTKDKRAKTSQEVTAYR